MPKRCLNIIVTLVFALACTAVHASTKISGSFTATHKCEAFQSIKKGTNPGPVYTQPGTTYRAIEANSAENYSNLRIIVPGERPPERWVKASCGTLRSSTPAVQAENKEPASCQTPYIFDSYVLALTWQPGFCEHAHYNGRKPECDAMEAGDISVANLTLHGLWPNKKACGIDYGHCGGEPLDLAKQTIKQIAPWMPNFYYQTTFGSYEWRKHGVCQKLEDDVYFLKAVSLVKLVDASSLGSYIHKNIGKKASIKKMFQLVEQDTGYPVKNMTIICSQRKYLQEIHFALRKDFSSNKGLKGLLQDGPDLKRVQGCSGDELIIEQSGVQ